MTEAEVKEMFGKSIWDMTTEELIEYDLVHIWSKLVDENAKD